ncbi:MAG: hypothetical protein LBD10_09475 [Desulfobulbus sp.]|jgi:hypothetical protein|uniref:hypothetical protein n=1 Tax=Desulfobulbus sp. TaxID=895 RepID=UPI002848E865|nr:hypothetical protein [Desulfobulbus sp.]MDR2550411.1 hypothetical protein [Desulfobulbus sp.]
MIEYRMARDLGNVRTGSSLPARRWRWRKSTISDHAGKTISESLPKARPGNACRDQIAAAAGQKIADKRY